MNDQEIIDLYFARDERAISETAKSHGAACMRISMNILANRSDAEECVNDTYLKAWNAIPPERPNAFRAWLCRVAAILLSCATVLFTAKSATVKWRFCTPSWRNVSLFPKI